MSGNDRALANVKQNIERMHNNGDEKKPIYDLEKLIYGRDSLEKISGSFDKSTRGDFASRYEQLIEIIQKSFLGDYGISNGLYKSLEDFISSNSTMKTLQGYYDNGIKGVSSKELSSAFNSIINQLKYEVTAVR